MEDLPLIVTPMNERKPENLQSPLEFHLGSLDHSIISGKNGSVFECMSDTPVSFCPFF
jgi:hypothetical protein